MKKFILIIILSVSCTQKASFKKMKHEFVKSNTNSNKTFESTKAIVVVGTTGTGKSSLVNLFSIKKAKIGHTAKSETQSPKFYEETSNRTWLDTQGVNDSNGVPDEKILSEIVKTLYNKKLNKVKIVWCVSGDMTRATSELKRQAKFIKGLGKVEVNDDEKASNSNSNIWNSCVIVKKQGPFKPEKGDLEGLIEAALLYGSNINYGDSRLIGFTYLNSNIQFADQNQAKLFKLIKSDKNLLQGSGFLLENEIKEEINNRLSNLPTFKIQYNIKRCSKCGVEGDERTIFAPCHTSYKWIHSSGTYHSGSWNSGYYYHSSSSKYYNFFRHGDTYWRYRCCDERTSSSGCCYRDGYYSCCNSTSSSGCKYSCCGSSTGSSGCKKVCANCNKIWKSGPGCTITS